MKLVDEESYRTFITKNIWKNSLNHHPHGNVHVRYNSVVLRCVCDLAQSRQIRCRSSTSTGRALCGSLDSTRFTGRMVRKTAAKIYKDRAEGPENSVSPSKVFVCPGILRCPGSLRCPHYAPEYALILPTPAIVQIRLRLRTTLENFDTT